MDPVLNAPEFLPSKTSEIIHLISRISIFVNYQSKIPSQNHILLMNTSPLISLLLEVENRHFDYG